jgi:hypothetical protein
MNNYLISLVNFQQLSFKCSSGIPPTEQERHNDPQNGATWLEATATISLNLFETYFGKQFQCHCVAWSSHGSINSRSSVIQVASKIFNAP